MEKTKPNPKTDGITVQNIYKKTAENIKIQDILMKSYVIFIRKEVEQCLQF